MKLELPSKMRKKARFGNRAGGDEYPSPEDILLHERKRKKSF